MFKRNKNNSSKITVAKHIATLFTHSIQGKLIIFMILISLIPLLFLGWYSYKTYSNTISEQISSSTLAQMKKNTDGLDKTLKEIESIGKLLIVNPSLQEFIKSPIHTAEEFGNIKNLLGSFVSNRRDFIATTVFFGDKNISFGELLKDSSEINISAEPWYKAAIESKGEAIWLSPHNMNYYLGKPRNGLAMVRLIKDPQSGSILGLLKIDIRSEIVAGAFKDISIGKTGIVFAVDKNKSVIWKKALSKTEEQQASWYKLIPEVGKNIDSTIFSKLIPGKWQIDTRTGLITMLVTSDYNGWNIIGAVPEKDLVSAANSIRSSTLYLILICGLITVILSVLLAKSFSKPIIQLGETMKKVSNGDLKQTLKLNRKDEFGMLADIFNSMINTFKDTLLESVNLSSSVKLTSEEINTLFSKISSDISNTESALEQLAQGSTEQTSQAEVSVNEMAKFSEQINLVNDKIINMTNKLQNINSSCIHGHTVLKNLTANWSNIVSSSENIVKNVTTLNKDAKAINQITELISIINSQTNLLSLNASIEAARAGESGRGFMVIANEIKKLSDSSNDATREIAQTINNIEYAIENITNAAITSESIIKQQNDTVSNTCSIFDEVINSINMVANEIDLVVASVGQMDKSKLVTSDSISTVSTITEEFDASILTINSIISSQLDSIKDLGSSLAELKQKAIGLSQSISKFKVD